MTRTSWLFPALVSGVLISTTIEGERPHYGGTIRVETQGTIRSLDPAAVPADSSDASIRNTVLPLVYETLVSVDPNGGIRPLLATSWATDVGAVRWRFVMRPGVRLHDGTTLQAAQAAAALRSHLSAAQVGTDGETIVIDAGSSRPDLLWELADVRRAIAVRSAAGDLVGSGPFYTERLEAARLSLRAHDGYWDGRPFLDGVRIEFARPLASQVTSLETGRADLIAVRPTDVRRLMQRDVRVEASRPLELFALVFEAPRADPGELALRRTLSASIDRAAMVRVLLQGHGEPARALLPTWLSGYPSSVVEPSPERLSRAAVTALPAARRTLILRVTAGDSTAQAVADRIAVDARDAGFLMTVQTPTGLAPRADLRLVRLTVAATSPERALASVMTSLGTRTLLAATREPAPPPGAPLEAVARAESGLLQQSVIVPVVHLPALYASGDRVESFEGPVVGATGGWNLSNVWLQPETVRPQSDQPRPIN